MSDPPSEDGFSGSYPTLLMQLLAATLLHTEPPLSRETVLSRSPTCLSPLHRTEPSNHIPYELFAQTLQPRGNRLDPRCGELLRSCLLPSSVSGGKKRKRN